MLLPYCEISGPWADVRRRASTLVRLRRPTGLLAANLDAAVQGTALVAVVRRLGLLGSEALRTQPKIPRTSTSILIRERPWDCAGEAAVRPGLAGAELCPCCQLGLHHIECRKPSAPPSRPALASLGQLHEARRSEHYAEHRWLLSS